MMVRALASAVIVVALTTPARADYTEVAPVRPLTLIDPSGLSVLGIDFQWTKWTVPAPPPPATDVTSLAFDVAADIRVAPHWMVLVRVPFDKASTDPGDCCDLALGNLTLGGRGLWARRHANGLRSVVGGELTVALPTASDGVDRGPSSAAAAFAQLPHDPSLYAPNLTAVNFTLLSQLYHRWWLLHAEAGLSLYFFDDDVGGDDHLDVSGRVALGGGVRVTYTLALLAEFGARFFDSDLIAAGDDTMTSLDLGVRYASSGLILGARFYLPLDSAQRDDDMLGFGLDAGWRF
jgi:hypothetical protein